MDVFEKSGTFNFLCRGNGMKLRFQKSPQSIHMSMWSAGSLDNVDLQKFYVAKGLPQPYGHPSFKKYITATVSTDKKSVEQIETGDAAPSSDFTITPSLPNSRFKYTLQEEGKIRLEVFITGSTPISEDICEQVSDFGTASSSSISKMDVFEKIGAEFPLNVPPNFLASCTS
jgi:hypothetical protein